MSIHTAMIEGNLDQREGQPEPNSAGGAGGGVVLDETPFSPVFPISSLRDIYNLPTIEQMETCIDEIKICMMQARATNDLFVALANLEGANVKKAFEWPETLPWHDDGKGDVGTRYVTPDGDEFMSMDAIGETSPTQTTTNL